MDGETQIDEDDTAIPRDIAAEDELRELEQLLEDANGFEDLTERVRSEREVVEENDRYRATFSGFELFSISIALYQEKLRAVQEDDEERQDRIDSITQDLDDALDQEE